MLMKPQLLGTQSLWPACHLLAHNWIQLEPPISTAFPYQATRIRDDPELPLPKSPSLTHLPFVGWFSALHMESIEMRPQMCQTVN